MLPRTKQRRAHEHFAQRVAERIGKYVDAHALYNEIQQSILNDGDFCRYLGRQKVSDGFPENRRIYAFTFNGAEWVVVVDDNTACPITVFPREEREEKPDWRRPLPDFHLGKRGRMRRL